MNDQVSQAFAFAALEAIQGGDWDDANRPAWLAGDPEWDRHRYAVTNMPAGVRSWDEANQ